MAAVKRTSSRKVAPAQKAKTKAKPKPKPKRSRDAALLTPQQAARELREHGWISLWVGQFDDEDDLDMYINNEDFEHDIGYVIDRAMPPFSTFADDPASLFEGWGFSDALRKKLERALEALDVRANGAILESDYRWDPTRVKRRARARVQFLGTFRK